MTRTESPGKQNAVLYSRSRKERSTGVGMDAARTGDRHASPWRWLALRGRRQARRYTGFFNPIPFLGTQHSSPAAGKEDRLED